MLLVILRKKVNKRVKVKVFFFPKGKRGFDMIE